MNEITINLNKKKSFIIFLGSISFTVISLLFILNPEKFKSFIFFKKEMILYSGIFGFVFFGFGSLYIVYRLIANTVGIKINENGLFENTTASSVGWINREDIIGIKIHKIPIGFVLENSVEIILVEVKEPNKYIKNKSFFKKYILSLNYKNYGTPITINSNSLNCSSVELFKLLVANFGTR
ncbi:STM3941 family protein [Halpernia sp. GG3]